MIEVSSMHIIFSRRLENNGIKWCHFNDFILSYSSLGSIFGPIHLNSKKIKLGVTIITDGNSMFYFKNVFFLLFQFYTLFM